MKLLSILNLSNRERPGCDSGVIFHHLLFSRVAQKGWDCVVASPVPLRIPGVRDVHFEVGDSKYDVRFRFAWEELAKLLLTELPDVLFVHQVELTSNFRALLVTLGMKTKLVTYCHYWPILQISDAGIIEWDSSLNHSELAEVILFRVLSAVKTCDLFFVTSEFAKSLLMRAARLYNLQIPTAKVNILPCPADPEFLTQSPRKYLGTKKVLYTHRLYRQYGTEFFIDLASHFEGSDVQFVVTDFFAARNATRQSLDPFVDSYRSQLRAMKNVTLREDGHIRGIYKNEIVGTADLGIGPFRLNANWSMSAVDCLGMGIPFICPNVASFPEFVPQELLFKTKRGAIELLQRLLVDRAFWTSCSRKAQRKVLRFSVENASSEFLRLVTL